MPCKARNLLSAAEVDEAHREIDRRLDRIGIDTQPEVAARILELVSNAGAGLKEYAAVIRTDPALSGRLLRAANSAFFAPRDPVTTVERAVVLLGLERIRAVSLGFYLSRAAADASGVLSRRVWGESVYRACLAAELSRRCCPGAVSEGFVIGLMLDAGVPLLVKLLGRGAEEIVEQRCAPTRQFHLESAGLAYTHVDVVAVLLRRWRIPEVLARPVERHHEAPASGPAPDPPRPSDTLHRIAYYVGAVCVDPTGATPDAPAQLSSVAERVLGIDTRELSLAVSRAGAEYEAASHLFGGVADAVANVEALGEAVHAKLVEVIDRSMCESINRETRLRPQRFEIEGSSVEVVLGEDGLITMYLLDGKHNRQSMQRFAPTPEGTASALALLGVQASEQELSAVRACVMSLAA